MGTQEGCRNEPVRDAPSGRDTAWGVFCIDASVVLSPVFCYDFSRHDIQMTC